MGDGDDDATQGDVFKIFGDAIHALKPRAVLEAETAQSVKGGVDASPRLLP